jgi:allantoate deiminase
MDNFLDIKHKYIVVDRKDRKGIMNQETKSRRIQRDIETLATYSSVQSAGSTRYTYSKEFAGARDYIRSEMEAAGLQVREDAIGTVIGRLEGSHPELPIIMTGSHFDTVKTGGRFDGAAGVAAALETARVMHDAGFRPRRSIEFVALPEEEGARFGSALMGSRAMCGKLYDDELEHTDENGISLREAMTEYGLDPDRIPEARRNPEEIEAFVELHIEQGPILEAEEVPVGIVDTIVGFRSFDVHVMGRSDHAGNTPMNMRADAFLAVARAVTLATAKAEEIGENTVFTCGYVTVEPGAFNIVVQDARIQVDCRSSKISNVDRVYKVFWESLDKSVRDNKGLSYEKSQKVHSDQVSLDEEIQKTMEERAHEAGIRTWHLLSGAGHDAMVMASIARTAMIFVPSKDGRSHVPEEWTDYDDLQKGAEVLYRTVRTLTEM